MLPFSQKASFFVPVWFGLISLLILTEGSGQVVGAIEISPEAKKSIIESDASPASETSCDEAEQVVFGFDLFNLKRAEGEELGAQILPPNYNLGPGDHLGIYLLGTEPLQFEVVVNVEGKIFIPSVGVFAVAGLTLDEFRTVLNTKLSKYYANYHIDLMLLSPKFIRVAVIGEVERPGYYSISALNSILEVVVKAGGPTRKGSLRNIELFRNGKLIGYHDLYNFLMQGRAVEPSLLQTGDRIFVPLMQAKTQVTGEVRRPALFELKSNETEYLKDIIALAGSFTEFAYLERIEISRLSEAGERTLFYVDYQQVLNDSTNHGPLICNQDWIHVYSVLDQRHQATVSIYGEVKNPGEYKWQENMRVSDLLLMAGNIIRSAYTLTAEVARIDPLKPAQVIKINLDEILRDQNSKYNLVLEADDVVYIRKIPEWEVGPFVQVIGEVKFPGIYPISRDSTRLSEVIHQTGGFTKDAMIREAMVIRKSTKIFIDKEYERLKTMTRDEMSESEYQYLVMKQNMQDVGQVLVDFHKLFITGDKSEDIYLKNGDIIQIPKAPKVVQVTGRVSKPGGVLFRKGMKLKYYLKKAGGTTWDADIKNTKVNKVTGEILDYHEVHELVAGDIIWVPRKPHRNWWIIFRDSASVMAQIATLVLLIQNLSK